MDLQFITDEHGNKTAAIIPYDEWERTEKAKDILWSMSTCHMSSRSARTACQFGKLSSFRKQEKILTDLMEV